MDNKDFNAIWKTLRQSLPEHDVLHLVRMPEKLGERSNPMIAALSSRHESYSYSARLPLSWEEFRERLPKKMLKDNARMIRRLTEKGSLEFKTARSAEDFHEFIEMMFDQKRRRYRQTGVRDVLADQYVQQFYRSLDRYVSGKFIVSLSVLNLDDEILATTLGVVFKESFSYLVPTYAGGDWPKFSPGRLLLEHLVKTSVSNQLATFDFTVGSEGYKTIWCDQKMSLYRKVEGASVIGLSFVVWLNLISWVKINVHTRYVVTTVIRCLRASTFLRK
jgi:CelD/BcsL family acetyltransferase involved in cellulose biosynthesis